MKTFERTGEYRLPKQGEYFEGEHGLPEKATADLWVKYWILSPRQEATKDE